MLIQKETYPMWGNRHPTPKENSQVFSQELIRNYLTISSIKLGISNRTLGGISAPGFSSDSGLRTVWVKAPIRSTPCRSSFAASKDPPC